MYSHKMFHKLKEETGFPYGCYKKLNESRINKKEKKTKLSDDSLFTMNEQSERKMKMFFLVYACSNLTLDLEEKIGVILRCV